MNPEPPSNRTVSGGAAFVQFDDAFASARAFRGLGDMTVVVYHLNFSQVDSCHPRRERHFELTVCEWSRLCVGIWRLTQRILHYDIQKR